MKITTNIEQDFVWLRAQRKAIAKAINEVVTVITLENLQCDYKSEYEMTFDISMPGNCFSLRIYSKKTGEQVELCDFWGMDIVFEFAHPFFSKERVEQRVKQILYSAQQMKQKALYYSKLNNK